MLDLLAKLDELHAAGKMHGFSIWPSRGGYQVNLGVAANSFRIRHGATPSEGVAELFASDDPLELLPEREPEILMPRLVDEPELPPLEDSVFD